MDLFALYAEIHRDCQLPVLTRPGTSWEELPPFEVLVMSIPTSDNPLNYSSATVSADFAPLPTTLLGEASARRRSISYPFARCAWIGSISVKKVVEKRKAANRDSLPLVIELTNPNNHKEKATLECVVNVFRYVQHPKWQSVMTRIVARGSSQFFERKLKGILDSVRDEMGNLHTICSISNIHQCSALACHPTGRCVPLTLSLWRSCSTLDAPGM